MSQVEKKGGGERIKWGKSRAETLHQVANLAPCGREWSMNDWLAEAGNSTHLECFGGGDRGLAAPILV